MLNLSNLKTPGVYIDEVPKFPPSIAAVETAIPAFIGYTERTEFKGVNYKDKPKRVDSMVEFEQIFGGAPKIKIDSVNLDENNAIQELKIDDTASFYLFDSLRMYFSNGGGKCFIVSLGKYPDPYSAANLKKGIQDAIKELDKEDDPTLFVFPDGIKLSVNDLGSCQQDALGQCEDRKDRFLIADVKIKDTNTDKYDKDDIKDFRTAVGMGDLAFGGAYYPYIKVNLPREVRYRDIKGKVKKLTLPLDWKASFIEVGDAETKQLFDNLENTIDNSIHYYGLGSTSLESDYNQFMLDFKQKVANAAASNPADPNKPTLPSTAAVKTAFYNVFDHIFAMAFKYLDEVVKAGSPLKDPLLTKLNNRMDPEFLDAFIKPLINVFNLTQDTTVVDTALTGVNDIRYNGPRNAAAWTFGSWKAAINAAAAAADKTGLSLTAIVGADGNPAKRGKTVSNLSEVMSKHAGNLFYSLYRTIINIGSDLTQSEKSLESEVMRRIPVMANVLSYIKTENYWLPPSGAIAGIYAQVDNDRGVWKAPANVSIRHVISPLVKLTKALHGELNVDPSFGKSINAIRFFTGKGTLVYGARTLAGNDNEWRYVSVRRFFNMVEESSKKATEQFVFESNDASTWVRVQAMIENFLTTLWRQGALQGATPEQAFYVLVGLGKTMTALDILEGRMIVEIGMAVVRPAEFIILRFSHKLPEA